MTDAGATTLWCPRCLRPVGEAATCPWCGLRQQGADAARLRLVVHRLYEITEQRRALEAEAAALGLEQRRLLQALAPEPSRSSSRPLPEWRPEVVRGLLLGLGAVLVALAAVIFAVVAWVRLGDPGRAGLLAGATLVAAAAAAAARPRLPATGEAFGGLALALLLVDWYAVRRAGIGGGWAATAWWALGTGIAAVVAAAAGRWLRLQRPAAAALAQASAVLVVATIADAHWTVGSGLALVAAVAAGAAARLGGGGGWRPTAVVLGGGAAFLELAALVLLLQAPAIDDLASATGPALTLATMAIAPAGARALLTPRSGRLVPDGLVAASAGALLAGAGALLAAAWTSWSLAAAVAVLGAAGVGVGRVLPRPLQLGTVLAASVTLAAGLVGLAEPVLLALVGPVGWTVHPWTAQLGSDASAAVQRVARAGSGPHGGYPAIVGLLAGIAGAGLAAAPGRGPRVLAPRLAGAVAVASTVGVVAVLPLAAGWPLWAALALAAAGALGAGGWVVLLDRRADGLPTSGAADAVAVVAGATAALLVLAGSLALATETGTLAFLGVLVPAAVVGARSSPSPWLRRGWGAVAAVAVIGEGAAIAVHLGGDAAQAGFAVTLAAGAVLAAGARRRHGAAEGPVAESLGLAGLALGVTLAAAHQRWLAGALTVAVPPLLLAAARPARRGYLWAGAAVAVAATWAWLAVADVTVVEAYTLPAATVALVAGLAARRGHPHPGSWPAYGPGLALALLPSLGLAVDEHGLARPLLLFGCALLVVLAGARARLQAPLVLGAVTLIGLAADAALPVAARLPRWAAIGGTGLLLLWLGATADRRLARLRRLRRQFQELEPDGTAPDAG